MRKGKTFDCPLCKTQCVARKDLDHPNRTQLKHPLPPCEGLTSSVLMQAYVLACKPRTRFPAIDEIAKEVYEKGAD